ncbi:hypothetical protein HK100_012627 [Physocladia obscura]|uniref:C2H2-type domain-containing protein n=1 Tax=Physocladia obscura TaxID=109957 RepID=A0AAD5SZI0_9FUNG|nr:hypothetical protein HK100_012627 [Physocladia obscura]
MQSHQDHEQEQHLRLEQIMQQQQQYQQSNTPPETAAARMMSSSTLRPSLSLVIPEQEGGGTSNDKKHTVQYTATTPTITFENADILQDFLFPTNNTTTDNKRNNCGGGDSGGGLRLSAPPSPHLLSSHGHKIATTPTGGSGGNSTQSFDFDFDIIPSSVSPIITTDIQGMFDFVTSEYEPAAYTADDMTALWNEIEAMSGDGSAVSHTNNLYQSTTASLLYSPLDLINTHDNFVAAAAAPATAPSQYFAVSPIMPYYYSQATTTAVTNAATQQHSSSALSMSPNFSSINAFLAPSPLLVLGANNANFNFLYQKQQQQQQQQQQFYAPLLFPTSPTILPQQQRQNTLLSVESDHCAATITMTTTAIATSLGTSGGLLVPPAPPLPPPLQRSSSTTSFLLPPASLMQSIQEMRGQFGSRVNSNSSSIVNGINNSRVNSNSSIISASKNIEIGGSSNIDVAKGLDAFINEQQQQKQEGAEKNSLSMERQDYEVEKENYEAAAAAEIDYYYNDEERFEFESFGIPTMIAPAIMADLSSFHSQATTTGSSVCSSADNTVSAQHLSFSQQQQQHQPQQNSNPTATITTNPSTSTLITTSSIATATTVADTRKREFKCSLCDNRFLRKQDMKRHEVTHTRVKRFLCAVCGAGFARNDALARHMRSARCGRKVVGGGYGGAGAGVGHFGV